MGVIKKTLINKIKSKQAIVGIIGLGYVGLPLAMSSIANFKVIGFDIDKKKVKLINQNKSYIFSISDEEIYKARKKGFNATSNFSRLKICDCIIICVPTPLNEFKKPELKYVYNSVNLIKKYIKKGQLISLESTTYPGTTDEEILPILTDKKFKVGDDFFLAYSPEREDPGNDSYITRQIPKVVGGITKSCLEVATILYKQIVKKVVSVSSTKVAEMTKLHENCYRLINLGFVNEMKIICEKLNIDIHEVIKAASSKPFGFTPFYPGPGVGGHCIPIDPYYLSWKAKQFSVDTEFINLSNKINENMPNWILNKTLYELEKKSLSLNNSKVLFIGVAYKKNIDDLRESPSIELLKLIYNFTSQISYSDSYIKKIDIKISNKLILKLKSVALTKSLIKNYDLVCITTNHDDIDYKMIKDNAKMILDTRGVFTQENKNIISA